MSNEEFVYCISNPLIPNISKCGGSKRYPGIRCRELSNTSLPVDCKLEYFIKVNNWRDAEKFIHNKLIEKGFKRYDKREWFECKPDEIKNIYKECENIFAPKIEITKVINKTIIINNNQKINNYKVYNSNYQCEKCTYATNIKRDFDKHLLTRKHIKNTKKIYVCQKCDITFEARTTCYLHRKKCQNNNSNKLDNLDDSELKIKMLSIQHELEKEKLKSEYKDGLIIAEKEKVKFLQNFVKNSNKTTQKALKITDKTISAIKYANQHFKNALELSPLDNFNILDYDLSNEDGKILLLEFLLYHYRQNSVHTIFGNHIVSHYKKENITEQSMHTTDTARLNYIIRVSKKEKPVQWFSDKNGVIICDVIIEKLISHYVELLKWYHKKILDEMNLDPGRPQLDKQKKVEDILNMLIDVDNGQLVKNTNKYIAPFFNLDK
jgi:hypothetical protein